MAGRPTGLFDLPPTPVFPTANTFTSEIKDRSIWVRTGRDKCLTFIKNKLFSGAFGIASMTWSLHGRTASLNPTSLCRCGAMRSTCVPSYRVGTPVPDFFAHQNDDSSMPSRCPAIFPSQQATQPKISHSAAWDFRRAGDRMYRCRAA